MDKDKKVFIASFSSTKPDLLLANFFANTEMLVQPNWYNSFVIDTNALPIWYKRVDSSQICSATERDDVVSIPTNPGVPATVAFVDSW